MTHNQSWARENLLASQQRDNGKEFQFQGQERIRKMLRSRVYRI